MQVLHFTQQPYGNCRHSHLPAPAHPPCARASSHIRPLQRVELPRSKSLVANSSSKGSSLSNSILSVVKDEQKYAAESYRQDPELLEGPPNEFDIEDTAGSRAVYLLKAYKQEQIVVSMDIQEQQQDDMELDDDDAMDEEEEEEDEDALPAVNFTVQVRKPGGLLSFQCTCDGHYVTIKELALLTPGQYGDEDEDEDEEVDEDELYTGPPFSELDDTLQLAFLDFLEERGINADLGRYLQLQHADKAAKEYQAWLARMHDFIAS